jgi:hypothetical protein
MFDENKKYIEVIFSLREEVIKIVITMFKKCRS